jgi:hypothetical protein
MFNYRKVLGFVATVCIIAGLAGCGGGAGTDNKKVDLVVCSGTDVILANGTCGPKPPLPPCPEGEERPSANARLPMMKLLFISTALMIIKTLEAIASIPGKLAMDHSG